MPKTENHAAGIFFMLLTGLFFVAVNVIVKHVGGDIPAPEAAFLRFVAGLVFLTPVFLRLIKEPIPRRVLPWLRAALDFRSRDAWRAFEKGLGFSNTWPLLHLSLCRQFDSVRDPRELAKLPEAERIEWQKFWSDVRAVLVDFSRR